MTYSVESSFTLKVDLPPLTTIGVGTPQAEKIDVDGASGKRVKLTAKDNWGNIVFTPGNEELEFVVISASESSLKICDKDVCIHYCPGTAATKDTPPDQGIALKSAHLYQRRGDVVDLADLAVMGIVVDKDVFNETLKEIVVEAYFGTKKIAEPPASAETCD